MTNALAYLQPIAGDWLSKHRGTPSQYIPPMPVSDKLARAVCEELGVAYDRQPFRLYGVEMVPV